MRLSTILMTVALGSVSGFANADIIDPFTTAQVGGPDSDFAVSGGLFNARGLWTGTSVDAATQSLQFNAPNGWCTWHNEDYSAVNFNADRPNGFQISFDYNTNAEIVIELLDITRSSSIWWNIESGSGTANLTVASSNGMNGTVDFSQIIEISFYASTASGSISNFTITAVPAPGAMALLGAAGMVARRRRR
jgi:hypothetical protein